MQHRRSLLTASKPKRIAVIPDTQCEPGVPLEHLAWAGQAMVDYKPDYIVHIGDHWTMPSLSSYDRPGSKQMEGRRYQDDIDVGNAGFELFVGPQDKEIARLKRNKEKQWNPVRKFLMGNHEKRIDKAVANEPKFEGVLSTDKLLTPGYERHAFLEIVEIEGIWFSHYFSQTHSGKAIGGSIDNRLNKIGNTFVQGHQQGFLYGTRQFPGKVRKHGLVCGSFYQHAEHYRDLQCQDEWRGIVILNEVQDGDFNVMPLTLDYLRRKYG
jgi:hypothetical protein